MGSINMARGPYAQTNRIIAASTIPREKKNKRRGKRDRSPNLLQFLTGCCTSSISSTGFSSSSSYLRALPHIHINPERSLNALRLAHCSAAERQRHRRIANAIRKPDASKSFPSFMRVYDNFMITQVPITGRE